MTNVGTVVEVGDGELAMVLAELADAKQTLEEKKRTEEARRKAEEARKAALDAAKPALGKTKKQAGNRLTILMATEFCSLAPTAKNPSSFAAQTNGLARLVFEQAQMLMRLPLIIRMRQERAGHKAT